MLPGRSGFDVLPADPRQLERIAPRPDAHRAGAVEDRVAGLDSGADDYLVKPFAIASYLARLRRSGQAWSAGASRLRRGRGSATRPGDTRVWPGDVPPIQLSAKEFALLETFMRRPACRADTTCSYSSSVGYRVRDRSNVIDVTSATCGKRSTGRSDGVARDRPGVGYRLRRNSIGVSRFRSACAWRRRSPSRWPSCSPDGRDAVRPSGLAPVERARPELRHARGRPRGARAARSSSPLRVERPQPLVERERATRMVVSRRGRRGRTASVVGATVLSRLDRAAAGAGTAQLLRRTAVRCRVSTSRPRILAVHGRRDGGTPRARRRGTREDRAETLRGPARRASRSPSRSRSLLATASRATPRRASAPTGRRRCGAVRRRSPRPSGRVSGCPCRGRGD